MTEHTHLSRRRLVALLASSATIGQTTPVTDERAAGPPPREHVDESEQWSEVVFISHVSSGELTNCSGVLVDDFHVLTAGHCVYEHDFFVIPGEGEIEIDEVYPATNDVAPDDAARGIYYPYDKANVVDVRVHPEFEENEQSSHDIALLTLDRSVGSADAAGSRSIFCGEDGDGTADCRYFPRGGDDECVDGPDHDVFERDVHLVGYPGDVNQQMWYAAGTGTGTGPPPLTWSPDEEDMMHTYDVDDADGMSGGPVMNDDGELVSIASIGEWFEVVESAGVWFDDDRFRWLAETIAEQCAEHPPDDMAMPTFEDGDTWNPNASQEMVLQIDGEPVDADGTEVTAVEQTLRVECDVRNVGPVDSAPLVVDFVVDEVDAAGDEVVDEAVHAFRDLPGMPPPYEKTTVRWDHTFDEADAGGVYQVRIRITDPETGELMDSDSYLDTKGDPIVEKESPVTVRVTEPADPPERTVPSLDLSATGQVENGVPVIYVTLTNTGSEPVETPNAVFRAPEETVGDFGERFDTDLSGDEFAVLSRTDDGGDWFTEEAVGLRGWRWDSIDPGESKTPSVSLEPAADLPPGEYTFGLETFVGTVYADVRIVDVATATISLEDEAPANGDGDVDGRPLAVRIVGANDPVRVGETLEVTAEIESAHDEPVDLELQWGESTGGMVLPIENRSVTVAPGATELVVLLYDDYPAPPYDGPIVVEDESGERETAGDPNQLSIHLSVISGVEGVPGVTSTDLTDRTQVTIEEADP